MASEDNMSFHVILKLDSPQSNSYIVKKKVARVFLNEIRVNKYVQ